MYIHRNISWKIVFKFAWKHLIFFALWAGFIVWLHHYFSHKDQDISIPFLPLSTIGIAVSFYLGFKNNSSYDRFWEARKIWGGIVNYSRTWGNQVMNFLSATQVEASTGDKSLLDIQKTLIYRHIAWLNALRFQLRMPTSFSIKPKGMIKTFYEGTPERQHWDDEVGKLLDPIEYESLCELQNTATHIIKKQGDDLRKINEELHLINEFRLVEMMRCLEEFYNLQGKCERIKKTPFPRQYAFFSKVFVYIFVLLLPFGLVGEFAEVGHRFAFLTIPFSVLISWIFVTMELVGDNSEDPFEGFINDVPMTALCRIIEIDLREMLGETDLPPQIKPVDGVLM